MLFLDGCSVDALPKRERHGIVLTALIPCIGAEVLAKVAAGLRIGEDGGAERLAVFEVTFAHGTYVGA